MVTFSHAERPLHIGRVHCFKHGHGKAQISRRELNNLAEIILKTYFYVIILVIISHFLQFVIMPIHHFTIRGSRKDHEKISDSTFHHSSLAFSVGHYQNKCPPRYSADINGHIFRLIMHRVCIEYFVFARTSSQFAVRRSFYAAGLYC